jgi:hypothetical protein
MPPDNSATVAPGSDVQFPLEGSVGGSSISPITSSTFALTAVGTYEVMFDVSVTEPGQLELSLNGTELAYTVVGRSAGTSQIVGQSLITVSAPDSVLAVENPSSESMALSITADAGGTLPSSASLIIQQIG